MIDVPIETVKAPIAIPMIASLTGERSLLEINFDNTNATNSEDIKHPTKIVI